MTASPDMCTYCFDVLLGHLERGPEPSEPNFVNVKCALFVTWLKESTDGTSELHLRGCIGSLSPLHLHHGLKNYALNSALKVSNLSKPFICAMDVFFWNGWKSVIYLQALWNGIACSYLVHLKTLVDCIWWEVHLLSRSKEVRPSSQTLWSLTYSSPRLYAPLGQAICTHKCQGTSSAALCGITIRQVRDGYELSRLGDWDPRAHHRISRWQ